jgi:hypothetical protein
MHQRRECVDAGPRGQLLICESRLVKDGSSRCSTEFYSRLQGKFRAPAAALRSTLGTRAASNMIIVAPRQSVPSVQPAPLPYIARCLVSFLILLAGFVTIEV